MDRVSLRFTEPYPPYNAGDIAGFTAEEARRIVGEGVAIYRNAEDIPADLVAVEEADSEDGDSDTTGDEEGDNDGSAEITATPLPDDFPAREVLVGAGFETLESVPTTVDELVALDGIGQGYADRILDALKPQE